MGSATAPPRRRRQHPAAAQALSFSSFAEEKKEDGASACPSHAYSTEKVTDPCSSPTDVDPLPGPSREGRKSSSSSELPTTSGGSGGGLGLLAICAAGVCTCYLLYGLIQERVMSRDSAMAGAGPISSFLVLSQTVTNSMVAYGWTWVDKRLKGSGKRSVTNNDGGSSNGSGRWSDLNHRLFLITSFCYFAAMASSNEALRWVSYPAAVLAKSSKLIPTMLVGSLVDRRSFSGSEWAGAALITSGIVAFNWSRMMTTAETTATTGEEGRRRGDSPYGLALLLFSLTMDGLLASCQGMLKRSGDEKNDAVAVKRSERTTRPPSAIETMFFVNLYACFFLLPASICSGHFSNGVKLLTTSSNEEMGGGESAGNVELARWIALLNLTAAGGQVFIFLTIYFFSPLMCTSITTTRKFVTILLSVKQFGHKFSTLQWVSIGMVFSGLYMEIAAKLGKNGSKKKLGGGDSIDDFKKKD